MIRHLRLTKYVNKLLTAAFSILTGGVKIPQGVHPVDNFLLEKYLGKWYEIARLDHSFERGLTKVSAH
jgi:apolipoprotein D and lipocalin family protein